MRDKRPLFARFLLTLKGGTKRNHIYLSQSNDGGNAPYVLDVASAAPMAITPDESIG